ncbi:MAG: alkaline phosphatase family protein [Pseudomonadota bacterium]
MTNTASAKAKKAVICVFDGLRPDRVTAELTPNLHRFATEGLWFRESRSVFPSMTRVATTSFATGSRPETHGIVHNAFFHRAVIPDRPLDTSNGDHLRAAEAHHGGRFVEADGLGCALARAGKRYSVVHSGSAGSSYLVNHKAAEHGHRTVTLLGRDASPTPAAVDETVARFGPIPSGGLPKTDEMAYAARVFIEQVLKGEQPDVALIWFAEPDTSYHYREIGSAEAVAVTRAVDAHFGDILEAVRTGQDAEETVVVAMSDHGQIATEAEIDLFEALGAAGFPTANHLAGGIAVLGVPGICVGLSRVDPTAVSLEALAAVLMERPETGLLFSRGASAGAAAVPGTLPFSLIGIEHARAPELYWIARSGGEADQHGHPGRGLMTTGGTVPVGGGMHGGLNGIELNTMLAFGGARLPARGQIGDLADLTDIVPTVLALLGCAVPPSMTGRPLAAVLGVEEAPVAQRVEAASAGGFSQRVTLAESGPRSVVLEAG